MSYIEDLNAITTPDLTDLLYIYQNGDDFKVTNQQLLDLIKTNTVIPLFQAEYNALTPAEKNNGSIYVIKDASITAADVEYSSGVSVKDKLDETDTALSKFYFLDTTATVSGNLTPTQVIKTGAISGGILKAFYQPILIINNSNANVYKAYIRKDNGNICAGENITAGTYAISAILYLA